MGGGLWWKGVPIPQWDCRQRIFSKYMHILSTFLRNLPYFILFLQIYPFCRKFLEKCALVSNSVFYWYICTKHMQNQYFYYGTIVTFCNQNILLMNSPKAITLNLSAMAINLSANYVLTWFFFLKTKDGWVAITPFSKAVFQSFSHFMGGHQRWRHKRTNDVTKVYFRPNCP